MSPVERFELLQPAPLSSITRPVASAAALLSPGGRGVGWAVAPPQRVECSPPEFCEHPDHAGDPAFFFAGASRPRIEHTTPATRIDAVSDAAIIGPKAIVAAGGKVFPETYWSDANLDDITHFKRLRLKLQMSPSAPPLPLDALVWRRTDRPARRWNEAAVLLANPWAHNWHHWLLDSLTRCTLLAPFPELAELPVIVPGNLTAAQADSLLALGIEESRWRRLTDPVHEVSTLLIPQPGGFATDTLRALRRALATERTAEGTERLFVSRSDASVRRLVNEAEIIAALRPLGFRSVSLTGMSFAEQRALFQTAAVIVGPHGAGLTNSLFSSDGALVVELHPRDAANGCFRLTTAAWNQRHAFLTGPVSSAESREFRIDPVVLRDFVEKLIGSGPASR